MDLQTEVLSVLNTFTDETWQSSRLNCFRWITTYFQLRLNFPFLTWLISRFYPQSMTFRFLDCEISPMYEEFCAIMDYSPPNDEFPALPPSPNVNFPDLLEESPIPIIPDNTMPYPHNIPLAPFLQRAYNYDGSPQWSHCFCYLILNCFVMISPINSYGSVLLLSVARQITLGNRTPHFLILGETMNWVYDTAIYPNDNIPLRGCPILLQVISDL